MRGGHDKGKNLKNWLTCPECGARVEPIYAQRTTNDGKRRFTRIGTICPSHGAVIDGRRVDNQPKMVDNQPMSEKQTRVLDVITKTPGISLNALAQSLETDKRNLRRVVMELAARGHVTIKYTNGRMEITKT